jgi:hypothetical protein
VLATGLAVVEMLDPAWLANLYPAEFRPYHGPFAVES